jgi:transposase
MRFVPSKTEAQQAAATELKVRQLLVGQRTRAVNASRGHLAEFGVIAAKGLGRVADLAGIVRDPADTRLPSIAREALLVLIEQIEDLDRRIGKVETAIVRRSRADETARRLATVPGIGALTANALQALVPDPGGFKSGRHFAAWLGLTPRAHSSGGKERLGRISRAGNTTLRTFLVLGATASLRSARRRPEAADSTTRLLARRPF